MRVTTLTAAVIAASATCVVAVSVPALAEDGPLVVISEGHVDPIDVGYEDGELAISYHDETVDPPVERDPATVISVAKPEAQVPVPDDPAFAFLGDPGDIVWVLPEDERLLFAGIGTKEIPAGVVR